MESSNIAATINRDTATNNRFPKQYNNSCKTLQRKLELKVERAKKNYSQQNGSEMVNVRIFFYEFFNVKFDSFFSYK